MKRNYIKETVIKHADRPEAERYWNFPHEAVEEAIVNAIYHRSYEIREPIEVRISPEELVVLSFPGPDRSIKMTDLSKGKAVSRRYRNRRVGEFLKELELTEGRSTGIPKILRAMKQNGSPLPEFESDDDRSYFIIRLTARQDGDRPAEETIKLKAQAELVLRALSEGEMSMNELVEKLGLERRTGSLQRTVSELLEAALIQFTIPNRPNSRLQKYQLTNEGTRHLESISPNQDM